MKSIICLAFAMLLVSSCSHGHKKGHHKHGHKHGHKMKKMWEKMDMNKDGAIDKKEFDKGHQDSFKTMDLNSDGKITKEEMKSHHKAMKSEKKPCCK